MSPHDRLKAIDRGLKEAERKIKAYHKKQLQKLADYDILKYKLELAEEELTGIRKQNYN